MLLSRNPNLKNQLLSRNPNLKTTILSRNPNLLTPPRKDHQPTDPLTRRGAPFPRRASFAVQKFIRHRFIDLADSTQNQWCSLLGGQAPRLQVVFSIFLHTQPRVSEHQKNGRSILPNKTSIHVQQE